CAGLTTLESTATSTGRNEFIKSPSSTLGTCLRRRFRYAAYRNSRRIPADNPIHRANMVLDMAFVLGCYTQNCNLACNQRQCKLGLAVGTLVIQEMSQN